MAPRLDSCAWNIAALDHVPPERLYPCTNCGMAPMATEIAYAKLAALAAGAELARKAV